MKKDLRWWDEERAVFIELVRSLLIFVDSFMTSRFHQQRALDDRIFEAVLAVAVSVTRTEWGSSAQASSFLDEAEASLAEARSLLGLKMDVVLDAPAYKHIDRLGARLAAARERLEEQFSPLPDAERSDA